MYHLKNIVKASVASKELTKILPLAMSHQSRGYSDHQIPERLQHIPTAQNPKFFDMVSGLKTRVALGRIIDFSRNPG